MDVARHGIFSPQYFSFYEVMCIFLGVMVTDVILLDIFNTFGMLKKGSHLIEEERIELKKQRRKEIIAMRKLKPMTIIPRNTWYFLGINSCHQMLYGLKNLTLKRG